MVHRTHPVGLGVFPRVPAEFQHGDDNCQRETAQKHHEHTAWGDQPIVSHTALSNQFICTASDKHNQHIKSCRVQEMSLLDEHPSCQNLQGQMNKPLLFVYVRKTTTVPSRLTEQAVFTYIVIYKHGFEKYVLQRIKDELINDTTKRNELNVTT